MAEYIVEYPDDLVAEGYAEECVNIHERIVRCCGCKHHEYIGITQGWVNVCTRGGHIMLVTSDGFCAWGEPKAVE